MHILLSLFIGAVVGWLAGLIIKGSLSDRLLNIILGMAGSWMFSAFTVEPDSPMLWGILMCTVGAVVLTSLGYLVKE